MVADWLSCDAVIASHPTVKHCSNHDEDLKIPTKRGNFRECGTTISRFTCLVEGGGYQHGCPVMGILMRVHSYGDPRMTVPIGVCSFGDTLVRASIFGAITGGE